ncbi:MAG: diacylglycerol/lipid kinase family protein, partial [Blautia sp.]
MEKTLLFIFNPRAGKGQIRTKLVDIVDIFAEHGWEIVIYPTQRARDAYEQVRNYARKVDMIVCSGGDGTLDEVVSGVMETNDQLPIGYIPSGSTNDFASSLFIPKNMVRAAEAIMEGPLYHCDIGKVNQSIFP